MKTNNGVNKECGMYFNMVCEEMCITGGKVIHIDRTASEEEVHSTFWDNVRKHPNAKWEIYPMYIKN